MFVIDINGPPLLFGRTAIQALNLVKIHAVGEGPFNQKEQILQEYADVFKEERGVFEDYEYNIKVNNEVHSQSPMTTTRACTSGIEIERRN